MKLLFQAKNRQTVWRKMSSFTYTTFFGLHGTGKKRSVCAEYFYENGEPKEFSAIPMAMYADCTPFDSISALLRSFYSEKDKFTRIRQKSSDLRRIVSTALERSYKKLDIQEKQLKDTEKEKNSVYTAN